MAILSATMYTVFDVFFFCVLFRLEYTRQDSSKRKAAESFVDGSSSDFGVRL